MDWIFLQPLRGLGRSLGLLSLLFLGVVLPAQAQYEIKSGVYNRLSGRVPTPPDGITPLGTSSAAPLGEPTTLPQFAGFADSSSGTSVIPGTATTTYPLSTNVIDGVTSGVVLKHSSFGTVFASGIPRYSLGDIITPPTVILNSSGQSRTVDASTFWRKKPLAPGERVNNPNATPALNYQDGSPLAVSSLAVGTPTDYYYSPHANAVFASGAGVVSVTWVSQFPDTSTNTYIFYNEKFAVSSASKTPVRNIYWTERSYNGPLVSIPSGQISRVNPVFSKSFPETVAAEVILVGDAPRTTSTGTQSATGQDQPQILRTLWFDKMNGVGKLHAYNIAGRVLVEYLGSERSDGTFEFLGVDVVNVERALKSLTQRVELGNELQPWDGSQTDPRSGMVAAPVLDGGGSDLSAFYGITGRPDGSLAYYAERTNEIPERVAFFWLEPLAIGGGGALVKTASNTLINWPKYLNHYVLAWPTSPSAYAHYTVDAKGSSLTAGTGLQFSGGNLPQLIYQDSPEGDASQDTASQRLLVNFTGEGDQLNRTLLKFSGTNGSVWYVPLMTQGMGRSDYIEGDEGPSVTGTVYVGERLVPPSPEYSLAAYVAEGTSYAPQAYVNPFTSGVAAAERGAVIPVNALPGGQSTLTVWWFKKIPAKSAEFSDFYTPAKIGRYTVAYREGVTSVESFQEAAGNGWSVSPLTAMAPPFSSGLPATKMLGLFSTYKVGGFDNFQQNGPATLKSFSPGTQANGGVTLSFLFYRVDQWLDKAFRVYLQPLGEPSPIQVLSQPFSSTGSAPTLSTGSLSASGVSYSWSISPVAGANADFATAPGATTPVNDQVFTVTLKATPETQSGADSLAAFTLGFGSNLDSSTGAFAIGNLSVSTAIPTIVLASNRGSGTLPAGAEKGFVYNQADPNAVGYNPNEEHALILDGRAYALRDDLNVITGDFTSSSPRYTSQRRVLIQYTNPVDNRPSMAVYGVERENTLYKFDYDVTAGTMLTGLAPMPLPVLPLPLSSTGTSLNREVDLGAAYADIAPATGAPAGYHGFTYKDRKGYDWVYRGPHTVETKPALGMQFYYTMRPSFVFPGLATQPAEGTPLPYLRPVNAQGAYVGDPVSGPPVSLVYRPVWPAFPPTLSVGETLALQKKGLPAVRGQSSAKVVYQQSIALKGAASESVLLFDPTRSKTVLINSAAVGLTALPAALKTSVENGKTYFQLAQPHLQRRFYFNPQLGTLGGLVLEGLFNDVTAGEDYLDLNTLSPADVAALKALAPADASWGRAIDALYTRMQTFVPDPSKPGTFVADPNLDVNVTAVTLPPVVDSNTAVDSYALTALGKGSGYVTLIFGDGAAFTPSGEPVSMGVVKVIDNLYKGDLKVIFAANPLDEQTTLRHSGDFGAHPERFNFEWRYWTATGTPAVYAYDVGTVLGAVGTNEWSILDTPQENPSPTATLAYPEAKLPTPFALSINSGSYSATPGLPGKLLLATTPLSFPTSIPDAILLSAAVSDVDGFVAYVNGVPALAYNLPIGTPVPAGLSTEIARVGLVLSEDALGRQFEIAAKFFKPGANRLEIALYSSSPAPSALSSIAFKMHVPVKKDLVQDTSDWKPPSGELGNTVVVGGATASPIGNPLLVFSDAFFTVRYKARPGMGLVTGSSESDWSEWTEPAFVPSWVKRVLDGINPFNQRQADFFNNAISTDVSVLSQAGKRWEGDVPLTLANINGIGLIEIYETVLNRVKAQSIDAGSSSPSVDKTLLLAAGYLNDLYMILGDEAADDATNPTLQISGMSGGLSVNSARYSFEGQVASLLEETLALWRGRDNSQTPTDIAPAYNRLYWNYVNGIASGEPVYSENYNIKEKTGTAANGVIDAADAQRIYPQGHGDAYGHYLTALKGYYKLLTNDVFEWQPIAESVSILGQQVGVDYKDERKFAKAAVAVAKAGYKVLDLTARQNFKDSDTEGWASFSEQKQTAKGLVRYWGTDEWAARTYQGAYLSWVNGNAMLPYEDAENEGVKKIDRTTVPELGELVTVAGNVFTLSAQLQGFLNPLGLATDAMAFDINPTELAAGKSHFEQLYERAVRAGENASQSFFEAGKMSALLRNQVDSVDEYNTAIQQQESTYEYQLTTLFGTPYAGDIGPGALYAQGYTGPDLLHAFFIDKSSPLVDTENKIDVVFREPLNVGPFNTWDLDSVYNRVSDPVQFVNRTFSVDRFSLAQFAVPAMGKRKQIGKVQSALLDGYMAQSNLRGALSAYNELRKQFDRDYLLYGEIIRGLSIEEEKAQKTKETVFDLKHAQLAIKLAKSTYGITRDYVKDVSDAYQEYFPRTNGALANDLTSFARSAIKAGGATASYAKALKEIYEEARAAFIETKAEEVQADLQSFIDAFNREIADKQHVSEFQNLYSKMLASAFEINHRTIELQQATERVAQIYAEADRLLSERQSFRVRAAAVVQGYRTRDVVFRSLRNEKLSQFSALFDLAQTYTYCAVKAYDYETGLLGSPEGLGFTHAIISNLSVGEFVGGNPLNATIGDPGLAGVLAAVRDDWSVARRRLGFNNPDRNGTMFSLRQELFRIRTDQPTPADNMLWKQVLQQHVLSDLRSDPDVLMYCSNISNVRGGAVPGIVIPFSTLIERSSNFFGWPLASGDHTFSQSAFATKILAAGVLFQGYVGMDPIGGGTPTSSLANALSATPEVYLLPVGIDYMRSPLGDSGIVRGWTVRDQAVPLPVNIGASRYSALQLFTPQGTLNEQLWIPRKHQSFRPVDNPSYFYGSMPVEYTNSRLVGRSVWNSKWKIVIPAGALLSNEQKGLDTFINSVSDLKLFLRTYSNSGN